jgi:hypothetical protein
MTAARRPKWQRKLTKHDLAHLGAVQGTQRPTLRGLLQDLAFQAENEHRCFECETIARKAGVPLP